jgi:hypothetical protein
MVAPQKMTMPKKCLGIGATKKEPTSILTSNLYRSWQARHKMNNKNVIKKQ